MRGPQDTTQAAWSNGKPSVFLVVFKIPGANVIKTVEAIKGTLTSLQASIPPTIHISVLSDRTKTIRASVGDVEFTLALTIVLMVAVIFIFLRSVWATIIRSVTVPLALLGACALMWAAGYSIDNLSLMAFTIISISVSLIAVLIPLLMMSGLMRFSRRTRRWPEHIQRGRCYPSSVRPATIRAGARAFKQ